MESAGCSQQRRNAPSDTACTPSPRPGWWHPSRFPPDTQAHPTSPRGNSYPASMDRSPFPPSRSGMSPPRTDRMRPSPSCSRSRLPRMESAGCSQQRRNAPSDTANTPKQRSGWWHPSRFPPDTQAPPMHPAGKSSPPCMPHTPSPPFHSGMSPPRTDRMRPSPSCLRSRLPRMESAGCSQPRRNAP